MAKQLEIDFSRGEQLALLREAQITGCPGVSAATCKAVLRAIDDYARSGNGCFASQETIAESLGVGVRSVRRAIARLVELSVITRDRARAYYSARCGVTNSLRVVWSELALLVPRPAGNGTARQGLESDSVQTACQFDSTVDQEATEQPACQRDQEAILSDQQAMVADQEAILSDQQAMVASKPPISAINRHQPPESQEAAAEKKFGRQEEIRRRLASLGLATADEIAERLDAAGVTLSEVDSIIEDWRENAALFKSAPRALVWRLRRGAWPVDGVLPAAEARRRRQAAAAKRNRRQIVAECEAQGMDSAEIRAELIRRGFRPSVQDSTERSCQC